MNRSAWFVVSKFNLYEKSHSVSACFVLLISRVYAVAINLFWKFVSCLALFCFGILSTFNVGICCNKCLIQWISSCGTVPNFDVIMHEKRWRGSNLKPSKFMEAGVCRHKRSNRYDSVYFIFFFCYNIYIYILGVGDLNYDKEHWLFTWAV